MKRAHLRATVVIAALAITAPLIVNAAPAPRYTGFCDSFFSFLCPKDSQPAPTPGPSADPSVPSEPGESDVDPEALLPDAGLPDASEETETSKPEDAVESDPVPAPMDEAAPIFTDTPASMGAGGLSFTGLRGISIVSVPTIDGTEVRALKISADSITITDFSLTVRPHDGPGLVTNADTMSLKGNVSVYLGSATASALGGEPLTLGLDTPPSLDEVEPGLLNVSFGLIGSIADEIVYTNTDQRIVD